LTTFRTVYLEVIAGSQLVGTLFSPEVHQSITL